MLCQTMTSIHEYENQLYELERRVSISNGAITASFDKKYIIPLRNCNTPKKALNEALAFSAMLLSDEKGIPWDTLALHMLRLAIKSNKLQIDAKSLYSGYEIRFAGEFESPKISDNRSVIEFKGKESNYLTIKICQNNLNLRNELHIKKLHCFTSGMHEAVTVYSIGVVLTNRHIILCLPEKSKWNLFNGDDIDKSKWYQQYETRLAIGFKDINSLNGAYSDLCGFLDNEFIKTPLWAKSIISA